MIDNEIRIHRQMRDNHFPKLYEVYKENGSVMLVMEFVQGETLSYLLGLAGKYLEEKIRQVMKKLLEAL